MRDVFVSEESDTLHNARRLSARKHVPNLQSAFWMMERERERAVRFSNLEIEVLVDLIKTHIIVEARNLDTSTSAGKKKAWENITSEFWTRTSSNRTEYQLLKKWKNLKHAARKYEAAINGKDQLGPGRAPPPRSPIFEEVLDVIKKEQEVFNSSRDTNTFYPVKVKIKEENDLFSYQETNDDRLCAEETTNWEQERCITSQEEISINNQGHLQQSENNVSEPTQHFVSSRELPISSNKSEKRTDAVEDEDASEDVISVGGCSVTMERTQDIDSSVTPEIQQLSPDEGVSRVPSNLVHLVHEKTLALKSAQLALLEKENKIKELDIKIREEQLTDIIIRRKHEQELHEIRKRRMLRGLSDC